MAPSTLSKRSPAALLVSGVGVRKFGPLGGPQKWTAKLQRFLTKMKASSAAPSWKKAFSAQESFRLAAAANPARLGHLTCKDKGRASHLGAQSAGEPQLPKCGARLKSSPTNSVRARKPSLRPPTQSVANLDGLLCKMLVRSLKHRCIVRCKTPLQTAVPLPAAFPTAFSAKVGALPEAPVQNLVYICGYIAFYTF